MNTVKRHAPPTAIVAEIQAALIEAFKDEPIHGYILARDAVLVGLRAANAKNDAGVVGYV